MIYAKDPDFEWLVSSSVKQGAPLRPELSKRVATLVQNRLKRSQKDLPFTLGIFGGWGSGKTTFLSQLARETTANMGNDCRIVYFNAWKYAGLTELLPALVYKILKYGIPEQEDKDQATTKVLLALGDKHTDTFGKWASAKLGLDPIAIYKDLRNLSRAVDKESFTIPRDVLDSYYGQVDRIQDTLQGIFKSATPENKRLPVLVLVDELDRCEPDEAFSVVKQLRVLFSMRDIPIMFVVCANPEPIGQAIKHKYGLESDTGDYEARKILEKFVDAYESFSATANVGEFIAEIWSRATGDKEAVRTPWIAQIDEANDLQPKDDEFDDELESTAFNSMTSAAPALANLRLLEKSLEYTVARGLGDDYLWAIWHLEVINQVDPKFRRQIALLADQLGGIVQNCYQEFKELRVEAGGEAPFEIRHRSHQGRTLFSVFRGIFWNHSKRRLAELKNMIEDPESREQFTALDGVLSDKTKMAHLVSLSLMPPRGALKVTPENIEALCNESASSVGRFSFLLASF